MDWVGLIRLGLGVLRLTPREFWRLTPMELIACLGLETERAPMTREGLEALLAQHPDQGEEAAHGT